MSCPLLNDEKKEKRLIIVEELNQILPQKTDNNIENIMHNFIDLLKEGDLESGEIITFTAEDFEGIDLSGEPKDILRNII